MKILQLSEIFTQLSYIPHNFGQGSQLLYSPQFHTIPHNSAMADQPFAYLSIVTRNLSLYRKTAVFFQRRLLLNLIPQTAAVATSHCPNDQK